MSDDVPVPPEHDDDAREALERDLRALFAPAAAPRRFRQQLKSELLRDQRSRIALPPGAPTGSRLAWLGAHRRTAIVISSAVAIAAALLLTAAVRGFTIAPVSTLQPRAPTYTPTSRPTHAPAVAIAPAPAATRPPSPSPRPTYTSTPSAQHHRRSSTGPTPRQTAVAPPKRHHQVAATVTPEPAATTTAAPTATVVGGVAAPAAVAPTPASPTTPPSTSTATAAASATATAPPARPATATPRHRTHPPQPAPTATPITRALTLPALGRTPAPAAPTATPRHRRETRPAATPPVTIPALGVKIPPPPAAPRATATLPLAPSPTATAAASATPRPTPSATPRPSATPSATASPTATPPQIVINPLDQPYGPPVPNAGNGILSSPLNGALPYAQQPVSYSVATTLTLAAPQELPVYPLTTTDVTVIDALTAARQIGATSIPSGPNAQPDGSLLATVQIGTLRYTLDVFGGYGVPWFTLHAVQSSTGHASPARVAAWADAWLRAHGLASSDLRLLDAGGDTASYGQNVGGLPLLGPAAIQLHFDGRGILRDLTYAYVSPVSDIPSALQAPAIAAAAAVDQGQGLYQGPSASTVSGSAAIGAVTLAYVGVHGIHNYLEPIYVLSGTAPTASGAQPFSLYAPALQYAAPTPTPTGTP